MKTQRHTDATMKVDLWSSYLFDARLKNSTVLRKGVNATTNAMVKQTDDNTVADMSKEARRLRKLSVSLGREVFSSLFDGNTEQLETPAAGTQLIQQCHEQLRSMPEWESLQQQVHGDPDLSAIATANMMQNIAAALPKMKKAEKKQQEQQQQEARGRRVRGVKADPNATLRRALRSAITEAKDKAASTSLMLEGIEAGLGFAPAQHEQENTQRLELAEKLTDDERMKRILKIAGRLRRMSAPIKAERDPDGQSTVVGTELGGSLSMALPHELAAMRPGSRLRMVTLARWADKRLQQYKMEGKAPKGRGPMTILLDESSSMTMGDRSLWSSSVVLACVQAARKEKRSCTVISFNHGVRWAYRMNEDGKTFEHSVTNNRVFKDCEEMGTMAAMAFKIATSQPRGGTSFSEPIAAAINFEDGVMNENADLLLITDGEAEISKPIAEKLNQHKKEHGLRCYGITISGGSLSKAVNQICDQTVDIDADDGNVNEADIAKAMP